MPLNPNNPLLVQYAVAFNLQQGYARNGCKDPAYQTHCMTPWYLWCTFGFVGVDRHAAQANQSAPWHAQDEQPAERVERLTGIAPT